jgi:E3 ubiquitin-protein ligase RAD18
MQKIYQGNPSADSECPICGKAVSTARINDHLDSNCKKYLSSGKSSSLSKSGQKDAWSRLLDGKRSGKEK